MASQLLELTQARWQAFLDSLYERGERLELRQPGQAYPPSEWVDAYVLSGHAEAFLSPELDGGLWDTLADLEEEAHSESQAWAKIKAFYLERGCWLIRVLDSSEPEEWLLSEALLRRLGLITRSA